MPDGWQPIRVLVTVKTYPTPAHRGIEVSCTAGVDGEGRLIRLFPIPFRYMAVNTQFHKYQWIEVNVRKASDPRPESFTPDLDSIQVAETVTTANQWAARRALLRHLVGPSMCDLRAELRGKRGKAATLGLVKPRSIDELVIRRDTPDWSAADRERLSQQPLFGTPPSHPLEKMPVKFTYRFHCEHDACPGHSARCTDWEMCETWRDWIRRYGPEEGERHFRQRYFTEMVERNNTHLYVGTHSLYPTWMVVGLFYPPKTSQELLL